MKLAAILLAVTSLSSPTTLAWTSSPTTTQNNNVSNKNDVPLSRSDALKTMGVGLVFGVATIATNPTPAFAADGGVTEKGVKYEIIKSGDGPKPEVGELVAIRFNAFVAASGNKIDDIFDTPEPYYTRLGSGGLLQGVETTLPLMRLGDRWKMTIPVSGFLKRIMCCVCCVLNKIICWARRLKVAV